MFIKIKLHEEGMMLTEKLLESFQGWNAHAKWADSYKLINELGNRIII